MINQNYHLRITHMEMREVHYKGQSWCAKQTTTWFDRFKNYLNFILHWLADFDPFETIR